MSVDNLVEISDPLSPGDEPKTVQSVDRALSIIEAMAEYGVP